MKTFLISNNKHNQVMAIGGSLNLRDGKLNFYFDRNVEAFHNKVALGKGHFEIKVNNLTISHRGVSVEGVIETSLNNFSEVNLTFTEAERVSFLRIPLVENLQ